jgi:hypothetical protein
VKVIFFVAVDNPFFWAGGLLLGLLLNVTANRLLPRYHDTLLRWGWFGIALYFSLGVMSTETVKRWIGPLDGTGLGSYVLAGLIGAVLAVVCLAIVNRAHTKFTAPVNQETATATTASPQPTPTAQPQPTATPSPSPSPATTPEIISKPPTVSETSARPARHTPRKAEQGSGINQTMTNSAGGIQAGGDVTIGDRPKPTPNDEKKNP